METGYEAVKKKIDEKDLKSVISMIKEKKIDGKIF